MPGNKSNNTRRKPVVESVSSKSSKSQKIAASTSATKLTPTEGSDSNNDSGCSCSVFLYRLLHELHEIDTKMDTKQIQSALHDLSDASKRLTSPVLLAITKSNTLSLVSRSSAENSRINDDGIMVSSASASSNAGLSAMSTPDSRSNLGLENASILSKQQSIGYWVVLATHTLQRLLLASCTAKTTNQKDNPTIAINTDDMLPTDNNDSEVDKVDPAIVIMAWISFYLSSMLSCAKLERFTSSSSPGSRQVYGRALLISTSSAAYALKELTMTKGKLTSPLNESVFRASNENDAVEESTKNPELDFLRTTILDKHIANAVQVCIIALDNAILPKTTSYSSSITSATISSSAGQCTPTASPAQNITASASVGSTSTGNNQGSSSPSLGQGLSCLSRQQSFLWNKFKYAAREQFHTNWHTDMENFIKSADWKHYSDLSNWAKEIECLEALVQASSSSIVVSSEPDSASYSPSLSKKKRKSNSPSDDIIILSVIESTSHQNVQQADDETRPQRRKKRENRKSSMLSQNTTLSSSSLTDSTVDNYKSLNHSFATILTSSPSSQIKLDGRLAIKRWSAVALTWYCQGHSLLLQSALALLLTNKNLQTGERDDISVEKHSATRKHWKEFMDILLSDSQLEEDENEYITDQKICEIKTCSDVREDTLPGNVTVLWFVCRLIRIVRDVGSFAGSKPPPNGGLDAYMKSIFGIGSETKPLAPSMAASTKKSKKRTRKESHSSGGIFFGTHNTTIPAFSSTTIDLRDMVMMLSYHLVQSHHEALRSNIPTFTYKGKTRRLIVNDNVGIPSSLKQTVPISESYSGNVKTTNLLASYFFGDSLQSSDDEIDLSLEKTRYYCYPFIHKAIDDLAHSFESASAIAFSSHTSTAAIEGSSSSHGLGGISTSAGLLGTVYIDGKPESAANYPMSLSDQQNQWADCIEYASAAYIVQALAQTFPETAIDARLIQFAIGKLNTCLSSLCLSSTNVMTKDNISPYPINDTKDNPSETSPMSPILTIMSTNTSVLTILLDLNLLQPLTAPSVQRSTATSAQKLGSCQRHETSKMASLGHIDTLRSRCTVGGIFRSLLNINRQESCFGMSLQADEYLSLFLRAIIEKEHKWDEESSEKRLETMLSALAFFLLQVIESCFDTRSLTNFDAYPFDYSVDLNTIIGNSMASLRTLKSESKKRKIEETPNEATSRKSRRQRKGNEESDFSSSKESEVFGVALVVTEVCSSSESTCASCPSPYRPLTRLRCNLATDVLDSMQFLLRLPTSLLQSSDTTNTTIHPITSLTFRAYIDVNVMNRIIELSPILNQILFTQSSDLGPGESSEVVTTTDGPKRNDSKRENNKHKCTTKVCDPLPTTLSYDERIMWTTYTNLCITIGRGHESYQGESTVQILDDNVRQTIYSKIASADEYNNYRTRFPFRFADADTHARAKVRWPLWLSPAHRLVVAANLTSEPRNISKNDEKFVVEGVINELSLLFESIAQISNAQVSSPKKISNDDGFGLPSVLEQVPLSLYDTRIFLLAFGRLGSSEKSKFFTLLLEAVLRFVRRAKGHENTIFSTAYGRDDELAFISSLLARVLTVCVNCFMMIKFEPYAIDELSRVVGTTLSAQLPLFKCSSDWYNAEKCFLGVFTDWEDSGIPKSFASVSQSCPKSSEQKLEDILEITLSLGFDSACYDNCQLLFTAWNALGKRDLWIGKPVVFTSDITKYDMTTESCVILLQLRDELYLAHRLIRRAKRLSTGNTLTLLIDEMETNRFSSTKSSCEWATEVRELLQSMISKASQLIDMLLDQYVLSDDSKVQVIPSNVLSLFEALTVYVSFAISSFTVPKNDFFSSTLLLMADRSKGTRSRAYSSESENIASDAATIESHDALTDTIERLRDVCEALGSVPAHPDWIDSDCSLWDGLTYADAARSAEMALRTLTKLAATALNQSHVLHRHAIMQLLPPLDIANSLEVVDINQIIALVTNLCWTQNFERNDSTRRLDPYVTGDRDFGDDIAKLFEIDTKLINFILSDGASCYRNIAKKHWCPHSAQRILGRFQDLFRSQILGDVHREELRMGGEWEILLSWSLASASVYEARRQKGSLIPSESYEYVSRASRWRIISLACVDSMVPTAALLRFGLTSSGRKPHPLSQLETTVDWFQANKNTIIDNFPGTITDATSELVDLISVSLSVIAKFPPYATCHYFASHLLAGTNTLNQLQGLNVSSLILHILANLHDVFKRKIGSMEENNISFIIDRMATLLEIYGGKIMDIGMINDHIFSTDRYLPVLASIVPEYTVTLNTIVAKRVEFTHDQEANRWGIHSRIPWLSVNGSLEKYEPCRLVNDGLLSYIWPNNHFVNLQARAFFIEVIVSMASYEYITEITSSKKKSSNQRWEYLTTLVDCFNMITDETIRELLIQDIIAFVEILPIEKVGSHSERDRFGLSSANDIPTRLCELLSVLLLIPSREAQRKFSKTNIVLDVLLEKELFDIWTQHNDKKRRTHILHLAAAYSCTNKTLGSLGSLLLQAIESASSSQTLSYVKGVENILIMFEFLEELTSALSKRSGSSNSIDQNKEALDNVNLPIMCSFASKTDFHEQHWYNCYTCGLDGDMGCCSLCALVCHEGHDVAYAKFSSFFCDCGAPLNRISNCGKKQVTCRCLSIQQKDVLLPQILKTQPTRRTSRTHYVARDYSNIVKVAFATEGKRTLSDFIEVGQKSNWVRRLVVVAKENFETWKSSLPALGTLSSEDGSVDSYGVLRARMSQRFDTAPIVTMHDGTKSLIFIGASSNDTFQLKKSTDSASSRTKKSSQGTNLVDSIPLDADARGRLAIAESGKIVFCSLLPLLNFKSIPNKKYEMYEHFQRSSFCVVGSVMVDFTVLGLRFSKDFDDHLAVWGSNAAKVFLMNERLSDTVKCINLDIDSCGSSSEDDCIVSINWLWGVKDMLLLARRHSLCIYNLSSTLSITGSIQPSKTIQVLAEDQGGIRNIFAVPMKSQPCHLAAEVQTRSWSIFLTSSSGQLVKCFISLKNGFFNGTTAQFVSELEMLKTHIDVNGDVISKEVSLTTHPTSDYPHPCFLSQSRILIWQNNLSHVLALQLSDDCSAIGKFAIFPYEITSELLGRSERKNVIGPYTNWVELGLVYEENSLYFSVTCCGQNAISGEPVLLYIVFNDKKTMINELKNTVGCTASHSVLGSCPFSYPCAFNDKNELNLYTNRSFTERSSLVFLMSDGCLLIYADQRSTPLKAFPFHSFLSPQFDVNLKVGSRIQQDFEVPEHFFPLLAFERLKNISERSEFVIESDGLGSASSIREKLIADSEQFLMNPRREGFTFIVSKRITTESSEAGKFSSTFDTDGDEWVIAALRICAGSRSLNCIPKRIAVQGRPKEIKADSKRWYTFHLSAQEIVLSLRTGFVSVEVSEAHDSSSNPMIDAVELYGIQKVKIEKWLPTLVESTVATEQIHSHALKNDVNETLRLSLTALSKLTSLVGVFEANKDDLQFVKQLVQDTTLHKLEMIDKAVQSLERSLFQEEDARQSFHDKAVLSGCSNFLRLCEKKLKIDSSDFQQTWKQLNSSLRNCLQTSANIARHRAYNYLQAADETPHGFGSIASDASKYLVECFTHSTCTNNLVSDFVELSLLETAVAIGSRSTSEYSPRGRFGSFDGLRRLLSSANKSVIEGACSSISQFCRRYTVIKSLDDGEVDLFTAQTMEVKYACDSCTEFIEDVRYTVLDDNHPFDLCTDCYLLAKAYSSTNDRGPTSSVIVQGKSIGEDPTLTCGEVDMMKAVEIKKSSPSETRQSMEYVISNRTNSDEGSSALVSISKDQPEMFQRQQLFDDFMDGLFTCVMGLVENHISSSNDTPTSLIHLAVDLVRHSIRGKRKLERAQRLAKALINGLSFLIQLDLNEMITPFNVYLDSLISLIVSDSSAQRFLAGNHSDCAVIGKVDASSNVVCNFHGVPTLRMQYKVGEHKGKQFLVCSKSLNCRCNYFAWIDESSSSKEVDSSQESVVNEDVSAYIWNLIQTTPHSGETLIIRLRNTFEHTLRELIALSRTEDSRTNQSSSVVKLRSVLDQEKRDFIDGVFCCRCKLQDLSIEDLHFRLRYGVTSDMCCFSSRELAVHKVLELLSLVSDPETPDRSNWFPILCKLMTSSSGLPIKNDFNIHYLATRALHRFCGNKRNLSEAICDHFVFELKFKELLVQVNDVLTHCVLLNEKARQCGPKWRLNDPIRWDTLSISSIVGTSNLVSEDVNTIQMNESAAKILCELWTVANKRSENWRRFCSIRNIQLSDTSTDDKLLEFYAKSPLFVLFALASSLNVENQRKVLQLLDLALTSDDVRRQSISFNDDIYFNSDEVPNTSGVTEKLDDPLVLLGIPSSTPEQILRATFNDIYCFIYHFVCQGSTSQIKTLSASIAIKLCKHSDDSCKSMLLKKLLHFPLSEIGTMGKQYNDFMSMVQSMLGFTSMYSSDVTSSAAQIQALYKQQIQAIRHDLTNGEYVNLDTRSNASIQRKRFNLACCAHCRILSSRNKEKQGDRLVNTRVAERETSSSGRPSALRTSLSRLKWAPEQVCQVTRGRLDSGRDYCTSNEFCTFFSLKHRFVISTLHLDVSDPRSRFVKTIKIYFSPRPVEKPGLLKSPGFAKNWQLCGQINLPRGAGRASCTLTVAGKTIPVVAANLKIEYADFYERPGSSKVSDGNIVVHCPRCARAVTNAHGVCSNCGEVAFQCRKCRHINYEGLDAFLCVECGYCSSGTFLYEVTAAVASNAITITNDRDYERLNQMASVAARVHDNIRSLLQQKLGVLIQSKRHNFLLDNRVVPMHNPDLERAFDGLPPLGPDDPEDGKDHCQLILNQLSKQGSVVKMIALPETETGERTRSLFRIARQIRSDSSSSRRSTDNLMIRHLGRTLESEESTSDFLGGLLEGSGAISRIAVLDPSDPLSRLLASVQSRHDRREADRERREDSITGTPNTSSKKTVQSTKDCVEECERLHLLMREAEREFYELDRRIKAWFRLESGDLCNPKSDSLMDCQFEPSHCPNCSGAIAHQLIALWMRVFQSNPEAVSITPELVALLLNDDSTSSLKSLQEAKHAALTEIALLSRQGSNIVLEALRLRLSAFQDINSAEIVGRILKSTHEDNKVVAPFVNLAQDALSAFTN